IRLGDVRSGRIAAVLTGHPWGVGQLAFLPGGRGLVAVSGASVRETSIGPSEATVWSLARAGDVERGRMTGRISLRRGTAGAAFSPDHRLMACGSVDGPVEVWDLSTKRILYTLPGPQMETPALAFSSDAAALALGGVDRAELWDLE